jgi:hypothetical protein
MPYFTNAAAIILMISTASCASRESPGAYRMSRSTATSATYMPSRPAPLDPTRKIVEQDCSKPVELHRGNLRCK